MANQWIGAESEYRTPPRGRQNTVARASRAVPDGQSRITDPRLIFIVKRANGALKRSFDILVAFTALLALAPAFATVAFLVWVQDRGPAFYAQKRIGRYGRTFKVWKFRSMVTNGDAVLAAYLAANPDAAAEWRDAVKLTNDPRVTALGRFLRKTSIDELPQLWNVLIGEMSLVGPRPITRPELDRHGKDRRYYLLVRPGITGLWQISGRSNISYERRVKYDREYVEQWSFARDMMILVKTIPAVLASRGAF
ncbi:MAG: sugar transferase [Hyphomonadaceae bacterium]